MGQAVFKIFQGTIIDAVDNAKAKKKTQIQSRPAKCNGQAEGDHNDPPSASGGTSHEEDPEHRGKLILDATVAPKAIRYPTDLSLLNEDRAFSEQIIDSLYLKTDWEKKPRTYREKTRKAYLAIVKQRRPSGKVRRRGVKQQLQYLRRNLGHIERLQYFPIHK